MQNPQRRCAPKDIRTGQTAFLLLQVVLLLSCAQLRLETVQDYSQLLPTEQWLYATLSMQGEAKKQGFPYQQIIQALLPEKALRRFVGQRLLRSQIAIGASGNYVLSQLRLSDKLFAAQMQKQTDWSSLAPLPAYLRGRQALQMPQPNLLYLSVQNLEDSVSAGQANRREMQDFWQSWQTQGRLSLPQGFRSLQEQHPLVLYSPQVLALVQSPLLQRAFPGSLGSFAKIGQSLRLGGFLLWLSVWQAEQQPDRARYMLHLELETGSLLLSKGLEAGFRLFLPPLLQRSKQPFLQAQLPNVLINSSAEAFHLQVPLDQDSLVAMIEQFAAQAFSPAF